MDRAFVGVGAVLAFAGVAAGAFGAHGLRDRLSSEMLGIFEIAVRYQMYHALGLILIGLLSARIPGPALNWSGWLIIIGVLVFSGSLYVLSLTGMRWMGAITPLGGLALLAGWAALAWAALLQR